MMLAKLRFLRGPKLVVIAVGATLLAVHVTFATDGPIKFQPDPHVGLTEAEREEAISKLQQRNAAWARAFVARGNDPRSLPVVDLQTWSSGVMTLEEARAEAQFVVVGEVESQRFELGDGLGVSIATVRVEQVAKGMPSGHIEVRQTGRPQWSPTGGELQQLAGDPLLLAGQQVVLLVREDPAGSVGANG